MQLFKFTRAALCAIALSFFVSAHVDAAATIQAGTYTFTSSIIPVALSTVCGCSAKVTSITLDLPSSAAYNVQFGTTTAGGEFVPIHFLHPRSYTDSSGNTTFRDDIYDVTDHFGYDSINPTQWEMLGTSGQTIGWSLATNGNALSTTLSPKSRYTTIYSGGFYSIPVSGYTHVEASVYPAVDFKIPIYWSTTSTQGTPFKYLNPLYFNGNGTSTTEDVDTYKLDAPTMNGFGNVYFAIDIPVEGYSACLIVFQYQ